MATRIGKYLYEDTLEKMSLDKLTVLAQGCQDIIKQKRIREFRDQFTALNLEADALGFDLCYCEDGIINNAIVLNQYNFDVLPKGIAGKAD